VDHVPEVPRRPGDTTGAGAALARKKFRPALEPPYRWRDWAANPQGITGDELLAFINQDEAVRPDGKRGAGLFAYLRRLTSANGDDRRDVIATVFRGVDNRMKSGYLLRDVINKVAGIHFTASDELHTLGALYESMLREMRDSAGDSGEFYTPRPVVRFMVAVTDPRLSEAVLDAASGTGGFLVEAFNHLATQVKTVADRNVLQERSLFGYERAPRRTSPTCRPSKSPPASSRRSSASRRSWATSRSSSPAAARDVTPQRLRPALSRADQGPQQPARNCSTQFSPGR
jgi:type I restriction-modification system DNA methylase subunit